MVKGAGEAVFQPASSWLLCAFYSVFYNSVASTTCNLWLSLGSCNEQYGIIQVLSAGFPLLQEKYETQTQIVSTECLW